MVPGAAAAGTALPASSQPRAAQAPDAGTISIAKTILSPARPGNELLVGENADFQIVIENTGDRAIAYLPLDDVFDNVCLTFAPKADPPESSYSQAGGTIFWANLAISFGTFLQPGDAFTVTVPFTVTAGSGTGSNLAVVTGALDEDNNPVLPDPATADVFFDCLEPASIGDRIWDDLDGNGIQNLGEPGLNGVEVILTPPPGYDLGAGPGVPITVITSGDGNYIFSGLVPNIPYTVSVNTATLPPGSVQTGDPDEPGVPCTICDNTTVVTPLPGQNVTTADFGYQQQADLNIVKVDNPDPATPGGSLVYTLTVTNAGPGTAVNVVVTDVLPSQVSFVSSTPPPATAPPPANTYTWNVGNLASGQSTQIVILVDVAPTAQGQIRNTASVGSDTPDPNLDDNTDVEPTDLEPVADLRLDKTVSDAGPQVGDTVVFTVTVTNDGPSASTGSTVQDGLPSGFTFVSYSTTGGLYNNVSGVWNVGPLAVGQSKYLYVTAIVNTTGNYTNFAEIATANEQDPDSTPGNGPQTPPEDDEDGITVTPGAVADLRIEKTDSSDPVYAGQTLVYTITVTNDGPSTAQNVMVSDQLPAGVTFVSANPLQTGGPNPLTWNLGAIAANASRTIVVTVTVNSNVTGQILNVVSVTSPTPDPDPENNSDTEPTDVRPLADLALDKAVNNATPQVGQVVLFTITVTNQGPSDSTGSTVRDILPSGFAFNASDGAYNPVTGIWTVGPLAAGNSAVLNISATVLGSGNYTNFAQIWTANEPDPDSTPGNGPQTPPEDDEDTVVVNPGGVADLRVEKTDSDDPAVAGETLVYTITVTNDGPSTAQNVVVSDVLPPQVTFVSAVPAPTSGPTNPLTWNLGSMAANTSRTIVVTVLISPSFTGTIRNVVSVSSTTPDPNPNNNSDTEPTRVIPLADINIVKSDNPDPVVAGQTLVYTLVARNDGPSDAQNVIVYDWLPPGVTFVSANPTQSTGPNPLTWNLGTMPANTSRAFQVTVTVNSNVNGTIINVAVIDSTTPDPDPSNNSDDEPTTVNPRADLRIVKTDSPDPVAAGDLLTYTLTVTNLGPSDAQNVVVSDFLPSQVTFVSANPIQTSGPNPLTWNLGTVPVNGIRVIRVVVRVNPGVRGQITNTAIVSSNTPDPDPGNNNDSEPTQVVPLVDLELDKDVDNAGPNVGDTVVFTVVVTNQGPSNSTGSTVRDVLPSGFTYLSYTSTSGTYNPLSGLWNVGPLAVGASATLQITARVNATGNYTNFAQIATASEPDPDSTPGNGPQTPPEDDEDNVTVTPGALADLRIEKTDSSDPVIAGENLVYTLTVTNLGPSAAQNVIVTDVLSSVVSFISSVPVPTTGPVPANPPPGQLLTWNLGNMAANSTRTIVITVLVDPETQPCQLFNTATVDSSTPDPNPGNNSDTEPTHVEVLADLELDKAADDMSPAIGDTVVFTLTVTNQGPSDSTNSTVQDLLPSGFTYVSDDGAGAYVPVTGIWTVGPLAAGASAELHITVMVNGPPANYANYAEIVAANEPDPDSTPGNGPQSPPEDDEDVIDLEPLGEIGDLVWLDSNGNGVQDNGEPGIPGVLVGLTWAGPDGILGTSDDVVYPPQTTDFNGNYLFTDLPPGLYEVQVDESGPVLAALSLVSGVNPTLVTLGPGQSYLDADWGFQSTTAVQMVAFEVIARSQSVDLAWQLLLDGEAPPSFHVMRSVLGSNSWEQVTVELISANSVMGQLASYAFVDSAVEGGLTYLYLLEGDSGETFGPLVARVPRGRLFMPVVVR